MWLSIHEFDLKHIEMENLSHIKTLTKKHLLLKIQYIALFEKVCFKQFVRFETTKQVLMSQQYTNILHVYVSSLFICGDNVPYSQSGPGECLWLHYSWSSLWDSGSCWSLHGEVIFVLQGYIRDRNNCTSIALTRETLYSQEFETYLILYIHDCFVWNLGYCYLKRKDKQ